MENLVVATFKDISDTTEGLDKLKELDSSCAITIYNILIVRKIAGDHYQLLHHEGVDIGDLPDDKLLAALSYNVIDRPLGMAAHIFSGLLYGASDFLLQFNKGLQLNTFSILLNAEEDSPSYIDDYLAPYQGIALRSNIVDLYHTYMEDWWLQTGMKREKVADSWKVWISRTSQQLHARIGILEEKIQFGGEGVKDKLTRRKERLEQKLQRLNELNFD